MRNYAYLCVIMRIYYVFKIFAFITRFSQLQNRARKNFLPVLKRFRDSVLTMPASLLMNVFFNVIKRVFSLQHACVNLTTKARANSLFLFYCETQKEEVTDSFYALMIHLYLIAYTHSKFVFH